MRTSVVHDVQIYRSLVFPSRSCTLNRIGWFFTLIFTVCPPQLCFAATTCSGAASRTTFLEHCCVAAVDFLRRDSRPEDLCRIFTKLFVPVVCLSWGVEADSQTARYFYCAAACFGSQAKFSAFITCLGIVAPFFFVISKFILG